MPVAPAAPPDLFSRLVGGNTVALVAGRLLGAIGGLVIAVVAARALGPAFGRFAALAAVGMVANTLVTFGTDTVVVRSVARGDGAPTVGAALRFQLAGAALAIMVAAVAVVGTAAPRELLIPAVALLPQAVHTVAAAVLRGRQEMGRLVGAGAAGSAVSVAGVVALDGVNRLTVGSALGATATGALITAAVSAWAARDVVSTAWRTSGIGAAALTREAAAFAVMVVATALATQGPLIAIDAGSLAGVAGFAVALRLVETARWLPASAFGALFPALAAGAVPGPGYRRSVRALLVAVVAVAAALVVAAEPIADRVFGAPELGATLIRILVVALPLMAVRLQRSSELIAIGAERTVLMAALVGLAVTAAGTVVGVRHANTIIVAWALVAGVAANAAILVVSTNAASRPASSDQTESDSDAAR